MNQTQRPIILLIDDDAAFLEVLSVKLSSEGLHIETASNGKEGIARAHGLKPDLMVLDMKMPGMDGGEVLHAIRSDPALTDTKVLFLSGLVATDEKQSKIDEQFAIQEGALGCIRKTDDLSLISARLKGYLGMIPLPRKPLSTP